MSTKVTINLDPTQKILLKRNLNKDGNAQIKFTNEVARHSDQYIPKLVGTLKNQKRIRISKIIYTQPYARRQYYENAGKGEEGISKGGLRGKQWDKRMWADRGSGIVESIAKFVGGRSK